MPACFTHVGKKRDLAKAQGAAITAWSALSGQPEVSAHDAVLGMLNMSWLRVHLYADLLRQQVEAAQAERGPDDAAGDGGALGGHTAVGAGVGLVGHTYSDGREIGIYASGEAIRGLAQLEAAERDRCVRFAKTAHDMGIAEAQIKLAEQQGQMLASVLADVVRGLGRDPADREVQQVIYQAVQRHTGVGPAIEGKAA